MLVRCAEMGFLSTAESKDCGHLSGGLLAIFSKALNDENEFILPPNSVGLASFRPTFPSRREKLDKNTENICSNSRTLSYWKVKILERREHSRISPTFGASFSLEVLVNSQTVAERLRHWSIRGDREAEKLGRTTGSHTGQGDTICSRRNAKTESR